MSIFSVGTENLPNVYIDKIRIGLTDSGFNYRIQIYWSMFDHKERSWKDRIELSNLKVKFLLVHDFRNDLYSTLTDELNGGRSSLVHFKADTEGANVKILPPAQTLQPNEEVDKFVSQVFFAVPADHQGDGVNNLTIYAAAFLDDFTFSNPLFNKFYGPMTSEVVFRNGETNKTSGYFYFPKTNQEYGGPVHLNPTQGHMQGSKHTGDPHELLRFVQIENTKIELEF